MWLFRSTTICWNRGREVGGRDEIKTVCVKNEIRARIAERWDFTLAVVGALETGAGWVSSRTGASSSITGRLARSSSVTPPGLEAFA